MKEEVKKISTGTWVLLIVVIVIMNLLVSLFSHFLPYPWGGGGISLGPGGGWLMAMPLPYVFSFLMLFLIGYGFIKIDKNMMALLYLAILVSTWFSSFMGYYVVPSFMIQIRVATADVHGYALPSFWFPSAEAVRASFYRGSLNNLFVTYAAEWSATIATHMWYFLTASVMMFGLALIFRRLWIDVEVLPFPHAQGWIVGEIALEKQRTTRKRAFIIAGVLGLIFMIPYMAYTATPALPDPYGWMKNPYFTPWSTGNFELTQAFPAIQSSIAAPISIGTDPLRYAFWFLVPLDALLSYTVSRLAIGIVLPQVLSYLGYYSGIYTADMWGKWGQIWLGEPLYLTTVNAGMVLGIVVFMVLVNWRYFIGTLKSALGGKTPSSEVSYGLAYVLFLVGSIGLIALFVTTAVEPGDALLGYLLIIFQAVAMIRLRSYTANIQFLRGAPYLKPWPGFASVPGAPQTPAGKLFITTHTFRWGTGIDVFGPYYNSFGGAMDGFKIASMAGIDAKTAFKLLFIGAIISIVIVIPFTYIVWHTFGIMELPIGKEWDYFWDGDGGAYNGRPSIATPAGVVGFVLAGVLVFLRLRYVWWPIEPLGFSMGLADFAPWMGMTFVPVICWIVKYVVIKFGGRKAYDEVGVPAAFGLIAGEVLGILICGIIGTVRFVAFGA